MKVWYEYICIHCVTGSRTPTITYITIYQSGGGSNGPAGPVHQVGAPQQVVAPVLHGGAHPDQPGNHLQPPPDRDPHPPPLNGVEREDLAPWLDPVVPGPSPGPLPPDGDGFNRIDLLGVWECGLSSFRAMEEVPGRFKEKWAGVMATILRRLEQSATPEEEEGSEPCCYQCQV
jgi:hypothetical protein